MAMGFPFYVLNPSFAGMKKIVKFLSMSMVCLYSSMYGQTPQVQHQFATQPSWADEFDINGPPNLTKWSYDVGGSGWGNNEAQYYTERDLKNARVENGILIIEAHSEVYLTNRFTSARLVSKGKGDFLYGRIEVRAKLPQGKGTWPAIWMLPTAQTYSDKYWPDNGEIDIMEHVGFDQGRVHASIHSKAFNHIQGTQKTSAIRSETVSKTFHTYRLDWTPEKIDMYFDNELYFSFDNTGQGWAEYPFDQPFHILLNLAIGGNWGGKQGIDNSVFPQRLEVDYVRVYPMLR